MKPLLAAIATFAAGVLCMPLAAHSQGPTPPAASPPPSAAMPSGYRQPAPELVRLVDAPPAPSVSVSPDRRRLLLLSRRSLPPVADLAAPMLRLAGLRLNPKNNGPHGPRAIDGLAVRPLEGGALQTAALPAGAAIGSVAWSPDSSRIAFTIVEPDAVRLWIMNPKDASVRRLSDAPLNAAMGSGFAWMPDSRSLLVRFIPAGRAPMPERPEAPTGPVVQDAGGAAAPLRTLQDMLKDEHDERLFEWAATAQPALIDAATGARADIGPAAIYAFLAPSPDGRFVLASRITRPYSYQVGLGDFPETIELWDSRGRVLREFARQGLRENIPIEGVETGPRAIEWLDIAPATLLWAEALDGGDPKTKAPFRDKLLMLDADTVAATPASGAAAGEPVPAAAAGREFFRTQHRYRGIAWLQPEAGAAPAPQAGRFLVTEYDRDRRWTRTFLHDLKAGPGDPTGARVLFDRSVRDRYNDPGSPLTTPVAGGRRAVRVDDGHLYLDGAGAGPEGERPFLDRMNLADFSTTRLWRCPEGVYEEAMDVMPDGQNALLSVESPTTPPNLVLHHLPSAARTSVTDFPDPTPEVRAIRKELVKYARADGVELSATLYLPPGHDPAQGPLPLVVWAYPLEFSDASTAGQVAGSPNRFVRLGGSSHLFLVLAGYAVMDNATMPVVGPPETANDTFIEQVVASAQAAIDKAAAMGVGDPRRVAVMGHSYGAFMTATLLAHAPDGMFRAGVARSGAYNRTLTPFGFQAERRTLWEARDTYIRLSPFTFADRIAKTPLLMVHGQIDNNPGTFPMQSERLFQAVKGQGGVARLVMLPFEGHGYQSRESCLHVLAETIEWLDRHVKPAAPPASSAGAAPPG